MSHSDPVQHLAQFISILGWTLKPGTPITGHSAPDVCRGLCFDLEHVQFYS